jgi:predicted transcriptional regulator
MDTVPGVTKEHPLYFKLMSEPIKMDWKKIGVMLAITIISGYVASQSQRMGSSPDIIRTAKMRALKMASNASWSVSNKAKRVAANIDKQYLKVTI